MTDEIFHSIFPRPEMVPAAYAITSPLQQGRYLCDGEIRTWSGPHQDVLSPVHETILDTIQPKLIGSYPLLTEEQALEALDAACRAYDHGRGAWPTMGVEERIKHVEAFAFRMQEEREHVVKLLMWEIG
ncbi:MAG: aldehyde dehydrogenase family protein, partial [Proteobacteria bacterium]|nr:aldehyde dehydrogenase family protein [Pseudomonadota bacterium]